MKKDKKSMILIAMVLFAILSFHSSCFAEPVVTVSFSSQMAEAFGREAMQMFMKVSGNPVKLHVSSSGVCIERLKCGSSDMAGSTRRLSPLEKENGLVEIPLCKDPLAVIVNKSCTVKNLSLRQLKDIFTKRVTNWKDVGGFDQPITIIIPEKNSGAFKNFSQLFMGTEEIKEDFIAGEAYKVVTGVSSIEGSISFIANSIAKNTSEKDSSVSKIFSLNINGKPPAHLAYPFQQTFSIVIRNENSQVIRDVLKFMLSDRVKKKIILHGMTPIPFKIPKVG